jgi:hypothetical protein
MKRILAGVLLALSLNAVAQPQKPAFVHGVNLGYVADYSTQNVFKDVMKESRGWFHQLAETTDPWNINEPLDLDSLGWPRTLAEGRAVATILMTEQPVPHAPGEWICLYEGDGDLSFSWAAQEVSRTAGRIVLTIQNQYIEANEWGPAHYQGVLMKITRTNPANPIRNIRLLRPGTESNYQDDPFNPEFIDFIKDFKLIRSMWWNNVIYDSLGWNRRNVPQSLTYQTLKGVPYEVSIDLANRIDADVWLCIPVWADDAYVRNMARLVRDRLKPGLKWYIEHGNEVWNGGAYWQQYQYVLRQAQARGFREGVDEFTSNQRYHGWRSKRIFQLVEEEFGGTDRIVRVMGSWTGLDYAANVCMSWDNAHEFTDALATAPYFGGMFGGFEMIPVVQNWPVDRLLDSMRVDMHQTIERDKRVRDVAAGYNKRFITYEAGQHLVNASLSGVRQKIDTLFMAANRHPRMYDLYMEYMTLWEREFGDLMTHYESISRFAQYGSWGLKEYLQQPVSEAPKYRAVKHFMDGQRFTPTSTGEEDVPVSGFALAQNYPNPFNPATTIRYSLDKSGPAKVQVFSLTGQLIATLYDGVQPAGAQTLTFDASALASGVYMVRLESAGRSAVRKMTLLK